MKDLFSLDGRTAIITGASGAIGGAIALGFARCGASLALVYNSNSEAAESVITEAQALGVKARADKVNILDESSIKHHAESVIDDFGHLDILVNSAGGNIKAALTDENTRFFDLKLADIEDTIKLNLLSSVISTSLIYGRTMVNNENGGSIINISSMNAYRPLEGRPAYAAAKAAVNNFTQWLACHVAKEYKSHVRVNAIAPGFVPNERMRHALFDKDGNLNARGQNIISHTPMGRLGQVDDLVGTAIWYASSASEFVTGTVTPIDGGFNAYAGL